MESNNSSSTPSFSRNTASASSSDPPPRNQRINDDKGKQTCSNVSEANNNNNSSSKFGGVRRAKSGCRWEARITDGKDRHLGTFETEEAAARAYDRAAIRLRGPTGAKKLNFDLENYNVKNIFKYGNIPFKELKWERFVKSEEFEVVPDGFFDAESESRLRNGHYNYISVPLIDHLMSEDVKDYSNEISWSSDDDKPQEPAGGSNQNR